MNDLDKKAYIFGSIFTLSNRLQVLGDAFDENITIKQWLFIACIAKLDEAPTISEVAKFAGYSRQNAKRIAAALEKGGFVSIYKDKEDARILRIILMPKCKNYFASRDERELQFINELFNGFNTKSIDGLYSSLSWLAKNIEIMERENEYEKE